MATITVKALPSTNTLVSGWPAPRQPVAGDDGALIEEAARFHDFTSPQIKKASDFKLLDAAELSRSIPGLRWQLHDATLDHLSQLMGRVDRELTADQIQLILLETLPLAIAKRRSVVPGADRARAAVRALLSTDWRSPERDRLLSRHQKGVMIRRFEQLETATSSLHALVTRAAAEKTLTESFGPSIVSPWGGDRAIGRAGRADSTAPGGGFVAIGETGVGLTEKLYEQFATQAFKDAHSVKTLKLREIPATVPGGSPFRLHLLIREQVELIYREVLPVEWKDGKDSPKPFGQWHKNLELLEAKFLHACLLPKVSATAIDVGFPWALVLTGVLRVYLTELIARVATVALPIQLGWGDSSGYLGVALWEALAGSDAPHATRLGYLVPRLLGQSEVAPPVAAVQTGRDQGPDDGGPEDSAPDASTAGADAGTTGGDAGTAGASGVQTTPHPLLVALKDWRLDPFIRGWSANFTHHQTLTPVLQKMAGEPVLISRPSPKDKSKPTVAATLPATMARWPRFPVCRFPGVRTSEIGIDLHCGAYLTAQCQLFIADQILRVAIDDLGLPHSWNNKRLDQGEAVQLKVSPSKQSGGGPTPAISTIAGSYLWAGSHPPHITHRDGATFDLRFGPDTVGWLPVKDSKAIDKGMRELGLPTKKGPYADLEGICLSRAQQDAEQQMASVFRSLMTSLIREELRRVYEPLGRAPTKAELAIYVNAEKRLSGTPHFSATGSCQQIHAGYVALLLSAPTQVIFSSPIAHLRAMRTIRFGLTGAGSTVVTKASEAIREAFFVFKPTDHWHHWHAQYTVKKKEASGDHPTPALDRWRSFLPLWTALGVELAPFADYLENLPLSTVDDPEIARVRTEREKLLKELESYTPSTDGREHLQKLFVRLSRSDPDGLLKPANATSLSPVVRAAVNESEGALSKLVVHKLIDKALRFIEAIGPDDLGSGGGDPTRERRD